MLYVYAAEGEAGPLAGRPDTLALGVGKVAAALTLARRLASGPRPTGVIAFGVAGAYAVPPASGLGVGRVVVVDRDVLVDEGVQTPEGFVDLAALGLPGPTQCEADEALSARVAALLGVPRVRGATVSTCSGTDALAVDRHARCGAAVETMEGAAIGLACAAAGVPWTALRAISNRTGDRDRAGWDLATATAAIQAATRRLMTELT